MGQTRFRIKENSHGSRCQVKLSSISRAAPMAVRIRNRVTLVHAMIEYHSGAPMQLVHIDFLGPLPKTAAGNEHILMMVDQFTK